MYQSLKIRCYYLYDTIHKVNGKIPLTKKRAIRYRNHNNKFGWKDKIVAGKCLIVATTFFPIKIWNDDVCSIVDINTNHLKFRFNKGID